ncbi:LOW QUALITY PROTEIN: hypothetical protein V2J09_000919 [Rumex salicifolius]
MAPFCCTKFLHSLWPLAPRLVLHSTDQKLCSEAYGSTTTIYHQMTYYYDETIDHFNYRPKSYDTFRQRYVMVDDFWGGPENNSPIFHRYYGKSNPSGSMVASLEDPEARGYFNSAQALADYAEIIAFLKESLQAEDCPVIVFGGSYGGMLASWFRLKYPHLAVGALASSAPVLITVVSPDTYYDSVTKSYRETSEECYSTIKQSWEEMDKLANQPNGLSILSQKFNTCSNLNSASELRLYLWSIYVLAAQYNDPPKPPLGMICGAIEEGNDILDKVVASINAIRSSWIVPMDPDRTCFKVTSGSALARPIGVNFQSGWSWQKCSEMINPFGVSSKDSLRCQGSHCLDLYYSNSTTDPKWLTAMRNKEVEIIKGWLSTYYEDLKGSLSIDVDNERLKDRFV